MLELTVFSLVLTVFLTKAGFAFACRCSFEERDLCSKLSHLSVWLRVYQIGKGLFHLDWPGLS